MSVISFILFITVHLMKISKPVERQAEINVSRQLRDEIRHHKGAQTYDEFIRGALITAGVLKK